ncbi:Hypothetical protein SRAE_2000070300 [Strongyloides ratti]|uniref:Uncharacterized protein n=1 Tax=Strongyloides ratti TaxID=34506 RepID=A0A090L8B0_STRRB|nr:Hypothetical protein SRAE_2000070300 [Strongyloides ratti]CEF66031.1 Hypothetical protein SRAE_2000070300 [Strongyloides ratti]
MIKNKISSFFVVQRYGHTFKKKFFFSCISLFCLIFYNFIYKERDMDSIHRERPELNIKPLTIKELKEIRKSQKFSGIVIKKFDKHLTFKWNCLDMLDKYIGKYKYSLLGKWMASLNGIVLGCVKTIVKNDCLIIEDQNCLHTDVSFFLIIFSPKFNKSYQCTVTKVEKRYVLGKLFDIIPCMVKKAPEDVSIGSVITFNFVKAEFKGKLAMLSGTFNSLIDTPST